MKIGSLVNMKGDNRLGILVSIKPINGLMGKAFWVFYSDGALLWSTESRLEVINEAR